MATLQPPRGKSLTGIMESIHHSAGRFGFPENMSPAEWHALCDLTRTALAVQSADILDEQLAGFGNILDKLVEALNQLRNEI